MQTNKQDLSEAVRMIRANLLSIAKEWAARTHGIGMPIHDKFFNATAQIFQYQKQALNNAIAGKVQALKAERAKQELLTKQQSTIMQQSTQNKYPNLFIVSVLGNVAAGKSTLIKALKERAHESPLHISFYPEAHEYPNSKSAQYAEDYFKKYDLNDPEQRSVCEQVSTNFRLAVLADIAGFLADEQKKAEQAGITQVVFLERSWYCVGIFANVLHQMGRIAARELNQIREALKNMFDSELGGRAHIDLALFAHFPAGDCIERMQTRAIGYSVDSKEYFESMLFAGSNQYGVPWTWHIQDEYWRLLNILGNMPNVKRYDLNGQAAERYPQNLKLELNRIYEVIEKSAPKNAFIPAQIINPELGHPKTEYYPKNEQQTPKTNAHTEG